MAGTTRTAPRSRARLPAPIARALLAPTGGRTTLGHATCGPGEAGPEHLLQWCPATQAAWAALAGNESTLRAAVAVYSPHDAITARVLHQASYLHHTLLGRASLDWRRAADLTRTRARLEHYGVEDDIVDDPGAAGSAEAAADGNKRFHHGGLSRHVP
eukprot:4542825-Lingulodinium_polyedra.AAC.1